MEDKIRGESKRRTKKIGKEKNKKRDKQETKSKYKYTYTSE